jgi:2-aminoadipate transaminase
MTAVSAVEELFSVRARNANEARPRPATSGVISFAAGFPDPKELPLDGIAEATGRTMATHGQWPLQYGPTMGYAGLIDLLVEKLGRDQGIMCGRENMILTAGGSQALGLLLDLFVDPGDTVLSEVPTWSGAVRAFKNVGATVEGIPLDDDGTRVDVLEAKLRDLRERGIAPKVLYMIPNFQNPGGMTTTLERRRRIIELAREYNFVVLEDDAYFDLRFEGERLPTLYELAGGRNVLYFGTFSKILAAGMRLGWIVGAPELIARLGVLKVDGSTNPFAAHVAYEYCKDGVLEARIQDLIRLYRHRRDLMLGELNERMPEGVTWRVPEGGFFFWLTLPEGVDATRALAKCRERGVEFLPGTACYFDGTGKNNIRLSFSYVSDEETVKGLQILSEVLQEEVRG